MKNLNFEGILKKAIYDFKMIEDNDRLAVGVSGGKDSLAVLHALAKIRQYSDFKFELCAITLDLGLQQTDYSSVKNLCETLGIAYYLEMTKIGEIVFNVRKESNPCSLCSNLRRGALNGKAKELGCNKVVLGHHRDDAIVTMMMSLTREGRFNCFSPVTYLSRKNIHVIRPMVYAKESQVIEYCSQNNLISIKSPCPANDMTNRDNTKKLIQSLKEENKNINELLFGAIKRSYLPGWTIKDT